MPVLFFDLPEQGPILAVAQDVFFRHFAVVQRTHVTLLTSGPSGIQAAHVPYNLPKAQGHFRACVSAMGLWTLGVFGESTEHFPPNQGTITLISGNVFGANSYTLSYKVPCNYRILGIRKEGFWWAILTDHGPYRISADLLPSWAGYPFGILGQDWEMETAEILRKRLREVFRSRISLVPAGSKTEHWVWTQESEGAPVRLHKFDWGRGTFEEIRLEGHQNGWELMDTHPYLPIAYAQSSESQGDLLVPFSGGAGNLKTTRRVSKSASWCWTRLGVAVVDPVIDQSLRIFEDAWGRVGSISKSKVVVVPP